MKNKCLYLAVGVLALVILMPEVLMASTVKADAAFGAKDLDTFAQKLSDFLFGAPAKVAAIFGGAAGLFKGFIQGSFSTALTWVGMALCVGVAPTFINGVFSMILP